MSNVVPLRTTTAQSALEHMLELAKLGRLKEVFIFARDLADDAQCSYVTTGGLRLRDLLLARHCIEQVLSQFFTSEHVRTK